MNRVVTTAGREAPAKANPRKEAIAKIRTTLRKSDATDAEVDDALEAVIELARLED